MDKEPKDISFYRKQSVNCNGKCLDLSTPVVMGIINTSPDSFYIPETPDTGKQTRSGVEEILKQVDTMIEEGALIIDIGACSSRPGASLIPVDEELKRLLPIIKAVRLAYPGLIISIDTFRAEVARCAMQLGADIINDISGGEMDEKMYDTITGSQRAYVLMHMKGTPQNMQAAPGYNNVFEEVYAYFDQRIAKLHQMGVEHIILDPGFGFGKTVEHNYTLLNRLDEFQALGCPMLVGVSRKSMINQVLETKPENALNGTTVLNTIALLNGANILRVHDVQEAVEAIKLVKCCHPA